MRASPPASTFAQLVTSGETVEQPLVVRLDPRVTVSPDDLAEQGRSVGRLVAMDCSIRQATEEMTSVETQLSALERSVDAASVRAQAREVRDSINAVRDRFESNPRGAAPLNLARKIGRLREEIEAYSGRPTVAQNEWVDTFDRELQEVLRNLDGVFKSDIAKLNVRLSASGIRQLVVVREKGGPPRR